MLNSFLISIYFAPALFSLKAITREVPMTEKGLKH